MKRWLPGRRIVVTADNGFSVLEFLAAVSDDQLSVVTRLRLDAALYDPAPPRQPRQNGRPRKKGQRRPTLSQVAADPATRWRRLTVAQWYGQTQRTIEITSETAVWFHSGMPPVAIRWVLIRDPQNQFDTQALLSTDPKASARDIVLWFIQRWSLEVTFEEVRAHLGVETQRQWSHYAIARTTPILMAVFSLVTLMADRLVALQAMPVRASAWYRKATPTFSDALALVRRQLWAAQGFSMSPSTTDSRKGADSDIARLIDVLCYAE